MDSASSTASLPSMVPTDLKERLVSQLKHSVGMLNNLKTLVEGRDICARFRVPQTDPNIVDESFITILKEIREVLDKLQEHCEKLLPPEQATSGPVEEETAEEDVYLREKTHKRDSGYVASVEMRKSEMNDDRSSLTVPKSVPEEEAEDRKGAAKIPCEQSDSDVQDESKSDSSDI